MSREIESQSMAESLPDAPTGAPTKQSYRSFKKKYAKLKLKFELGMKESESLIREELRIEDISKRIQEQNDQLLEVLLEFNNSLHVAPNLRYDLSAPGDSAFLPTPERSPVHNDPAVAKNILKDAKARMTNGTLTLEDYRNLESDVKRGKAFAPQMRYTSLTKFPHTGPPGEEQSFSAETKFEHNLGFLTPEHETEYCLTTDARLGDKPAVLQLSRAPEKASLAERERNSALKNPISVYNWLRRNQPHIFLQDNENASEKSGPRPSNLRTSKRVSTLPRKEGEANDEDSVLLDAGSAAGTAKGKRKRDEDAGYKPKSGSRSNRKKKDDITSNPKRSSKRASAAGA